jgi:hypothetical protein
MIDHTGFPVSDHARPKAFYLKQSSPAPVAGFGGEGGPDKPLHVEITAKDRATVDAFYKAALAAGGRDKWRARHSRPLSSGLLQRVCARPRRSHH